MSRGEKIVLVLTALLLCTGFAFLLLGERDAGHYSISALPEPTESAAQEPGGRINLNAASAEELAEATGAEVVQTVGSKLVLYKESEKKKRIELP